jgi:hypothetical protein
MAHPAGIEPAAPSEGRAVSNLNMYLSVLIVVSCCYIRIYILLVTTIEND